MQAAIGKVGEAVFQTHVQGCMLEAMKCGDERTREREMEALVSILGRYNRVREE